MPNDVEKVDGTKPWQTAPKPKTHNKNWVCMEAKQRKIGSGRQRIFHKEAAVMAKFMLPAFVATVSMVGIFFYPHPVTLCFALFIFFNQCPRMCRVLLLFQM
jgi:hypothetical protein